MSVAQSRPAPALRPMAMLWTVALMLVAMVPWITGSTFHFHIAIMVCISAMATGGLAVTAWVGQLSLAHAAFAGLGAYTSVLLVTRLDLPVLLGLPAGALVAGAVAFVIGAPLLRLRGVYFVLITFALNELFRLIMLDVPELSGGSSGIASIPKLSVFGITLSNYEDVYPFALLCLALVMGLLALVRRGQLGRRFGAVEENLALAEASGIPTARTQNLAFTIGSAIAGFSGAFLAHYVGFISPETFGFQLSVSYVIMLVTGGRLALWGPLIGALFLTPLPEFLRGAVEYQHIIYGIILIAVLRFLPQGLAGLPAQLSRKGGRS